MLLTVDSRADKDTWDEVTAHGVESGAFDSTLDQRMAVQALPGICASLLECPGPNVRLPPQEAARAYAEIVLRDPAAGDR